MKNIGQSLKRKIGPLPAWAWAAVVFVGVYYYRKKFGAMASGTGTGSVGPAPATPQQGQVLQPGESFYDPNTGALTTAPGGGGSDSGNGGGNDLAAIQALAQAIEDAIAANSNTGGGGGNRTTPPGKRTKGKGPTGQGKGRPKLKGKGAVYAPSGAKKPKARPGFVIRGLGRGFWEYVPKRKAKSKPAHTSPTNAKTKPHVTSTRRQRSSTNIRNPLAGRTGKRGKAPRTTGQTRGAPKGNVTRYYSGTARKHGVVSHPTVRQRPVANVSPHTAPRTAVRTAPRPSAPPPRTHRRPVRK